MPHPGPVLLHAGEPHAPPLFLVPGLTGAPSEMHALADAMRGAWPVYGLAAPGVDDPATQPVASIEALAEHHMRVVLAHQPHGPYALAGYSFGGLVALEIARRLHAYGEPVAFLGFFESYVHPQYWPRLARAGVVASIAWRRLDRMLHAPPRDTLAYLADRGGRLARRLTRARPAPPDGAPASPKPVFDWFLSEIPPADLPTATQRVFTANVLALRQYRPRPYAGKVVLFQPRHRPDFPKRARHMWRTLIPDMTVIQVAGDHRSMMAQHVAVLAAQLETQLAAALPPRVRGAG